MKTCISFTLFAMMAGICGCDASSDQRILAAHMVEHLEKNGFKGRMVGGTGSSMNVFQKSGWYINLMFRGKITADMDLATVKKKFTRVALDQLPTPGLDVQG